MDSNNKQQEHVPSEAESMRRLVEWYKERTGKEPEAGTAVGMLTALLMGRVLVMKRTWYGAQAWAVRGDVRDVLE